jgi:hypothetical protein
VKRVSGVDHLVIGTSATNPGVRIELIEELTDLLYTSFFKGVTMDYSEFTATLAVVEQSDELARHSSAEQKRGIERQKSAASFNVNRKFTQVMPLVNKLGTLRQQSKGTS